jgi:hypothetical protein
MSKLKVVEKNELSQEDEILAMQGIGAENVTSRDITIPRLTILQSMSPQLSRKKPEWIEGAEVGDWCNTATGDIQKGVITVIPCLFQTSYLEWSKQRGGFIADHGDDPDILRKCVRNEKWEYFLPNGNKVEENAQWFVLVRDGPEGAPWNPAYLPLKSTALKHSKKWLTACCPASFMRKGELFRPPLFWWSWKLETVSVSNDFGDWCAPRFERERETIEIDPSLKLARQARAFRDAVTSKALRADEEHAPASDPPPVAEPAPAEEAIPFA